MIRRDDVFTEAFFKTRSFPDFRNVVLYIEDSALIRNLFEICGISCYFVPPPVDPGFDPGFIPDCLIFDHKTHPQFIRDQIKNYHPRKIVIVTTHPSKSNLRRFEAMLRQSGYGTDAKFAREAAQAISPRMRSCFFVLEQGAELVPNSFYSPRDMRPFGQGYPGFAPPQVAATASGASADSDAAAELRKIKDSHAYKACLMLSKFVKSNKLMFTMASAALALRRRYKNWGNR